MDMPDAKASRMVYRHSLQGMHARSLHVEATPLRNSATSGAVVPWRTHVHMARMHACMYLVTYAF